MQTSGSQYGRMKGHLSISETEPGGKSSANSRFIRFHLNNIIGGIAAPTAFAHATTVTLSP
jgi:hypothetical protein